MKDEKFISIDFQTWETKYKPMEAENERLRLELSSNDVIIYVQAKQDIMSSFLGSGFERRPLKIGYITSSGDFYKQPDYEITLNTIRSDIEFQVRERGEYKILNSKEQCEEYKAILNEMAVSIEKSQSKLSSDFKSWEREKSKQDFKIMRSNDKINSLPKVLKWILGIKNV